MNIDGSKTLSSDNKYKFLLAGGELLKKSCIKIASTSKKLPSFHLQILTNPKESQLSAKELFGLVLGDWFHGPKDYEEKLLTKMMHLFQQTVAKHCQSVAIPLEVGQKVPSFVMAKACFRALKAFLAENPGTVLKRVSLCTVDKLCLPSLINLLESEFDLQVQDPEKAFADPLGVSLPQKEKQLDNDNSRFEGNNIHTGSIFINFLLSRVFIIK